MQVKDVLQKTQEFFKKREIPNARVEAELLLSEGLGWQRIDLYTRFDYPITEPELTKCRELVQRRLKGEPLAYIIGHQDFFGLTFKVSPGVLIPRPETEQLVELSLESLKGLLEKKSKIKIADFGSGSGCIGITLAKNISESQVECFEQSLKAIEIIGENISHYNLNDRCQVVAIDLDQADSLEMVEKGHWQYDAIVSNPPYIAVNDTRVESSVKMYEPHEALYADDEGMAKIKDWGQLALDLLLPGGYLFFEIGWDQGKKVENYFKSLDGVARVEIRKDFSGHDRFALIVKDDLGPVA